MATVVTSVALPPSPVFDTGIPPLCAGDHLTRDEFERRYHAMPHVKKAELIEGIVYISSPVSLKHSVPHSLVVTWLGTYWTATPGTQLCDNGTVRLDLDNEPQPDGMLRILPECGGQSHDDSEYVCGAPELVAEIAASSESYDMYEKLDAYRRNGVREYIVWRIRDRTVDWFVLREGRFVKLTADSSSLLKSETFPGLWLDATALVAVDPARVMSALQQGIASPEHAAFVAKLQAARQQRST